MCCAYPLPFRVELFMKMYYKIFLVTFFMFKYVKVGNYNKYMGQKFKKYAHCTIFSRDELSASLFSLSLSRN